MRIDAHHHFWHYQAADYPWMTAAMKVLQRDYLPGDLAPLLDSHQLTGSIVVQARQCATETEQLLRWAGASPATQAVIGWVDLRQGDLAAQLETLRHPLLRGFRHQVQDERDPAAWLRDAATASGINQLQRQRYVWEMLVTWRHLPETTRFAAHHDNHWLVLDHLGKPDIAAGAKSWRKQVAGLAAMPHVVCKLSGLVTEVLNPPWRAEQLRPFIEEAIALFGPQRLMFGSDWPVCLLAAGYDEVVQLVEEVIGSLTPAERDNIWGDTAGRVYGLSGEQNGSIVAK